MHYIHVTAESGSHCELYSGSIHIHDIQNATEVIPEPLLSSRVPDLQFDAFAWLNLHQTGKEIHSDGGVRHLCKTPLCETSDQTRLAYCRVANDDQSELV